MGDWNIINRPMVSVIIPNWNGKIVIRDCLTSVQRLTYPNFEIIVVDNGSSDGSREMIREEFPTAKLIASPINLGYARACNLGIKAAKGVLIALFNNDATAESSWLSKLVDSICREDDIAIASGLTFHDKPCDVLWSAGARIDAITGEPFQIGRGQHLNQIKCSEDFDYLSGCAIIFRRDIIDKVGLFDENFFFYCEDLDWAFRAKRMGYKIRLNSTAIVWHKASITGRRNPLIGYYHLRRGLFRIYFKHFPLRYLFTSLFFQVVLFPIFEALIFRTSKLYILQRMRAFAWNISNLKEIQIERNRVNSIGKIELKNRFRELLATTNRYRASNSYYY
jgi:GT2 family glycosyltransferase